jgi:hypothetical protein
MYLTDESLVIVLVVAALAVLGHAVALIVPLIRWAVRRVKPRERPEAAPDGRRRPGTGRRLAEAVRDAFRLPSS